MSAIFTDPPGPHSGRGRRSMIDIGWDPEALRWGKESPAGKALNAIRGGAHFSEAALYAGISVDTLRRWLMTGRTYMLDNFGDECADEDVRMLHPNKQMYVSFFRAASQNEATLAVEMISKWRTAADEDWRAARDFLARRFPTNWQPRDRLEITTDSATEGESVAIDLLLQDPEARQLLAQLEERIAIGTGSAATDEEEDIIDAVIVDDGPLSSPPPPKREPPTDSFGDSLIG